MMCCTVPAGEPSRQVFDCVCAATAGLPVDNIIEPATRTIIAARRGARRIRSRIDRSQNLREVARTQGSGLIRRANDLADRFESESASESESESESERRLSSRHT